MEAAQRIRQAVHQVSQLRSRGALMPGTMASVRAVKALQARRFGGSYADMLAGGEHEAAARFFLEELYSDKDYAERDAQFARIAGAMQTFFPAQVVQTAVALAELHALTEELDYQMGEVWATRSTAAGQTDAGRYVQAWREVGRRDERMRQLDTVLGIGHDMARLTRKPGLGLMLRMMRGPASAAGLDSLQRFLEAGFDTFARMARRRDSAEVFLRTIKERENDLIRALFDAPAVTCETELQRLLGLAR
ncbi:MAG: hypothetical protein KF686_20815 [Ramlibacter sp.]|nr:hypothetical protein [Ramlibacter sp.]